ncbi:hypothetical protein BS47DRAFT_1344174 [Hydnum rufescens UP504]|uniref:RING-type domain-containing protein n=1 Tax=Hydnum rufescens UP504 TaxID=1448309 RepID=A0A9P6AWX7_9AGAM|nr:hypothetical protein BS47DRAFT_1344174 [Hydnum rufescens UP504]
MPTPELVDLTESPDAPFPSPTAAGVHPYAIRSPSNSPTSRSRKRQRVDDGESSTYLGQTQIDVPSMNPGTVDGTPGPSVASELKPDSKRPQTDPPPSRTPLGQYTCPICFSPPRPATLTPCGHILCASCLFGALRSARDRATSPSDVNTARCPVCRAVLRGWDWRGGGIIGIEAKVLKS